MLLIIHNRAKRQKAKLALLIILKLSVE